MAPRLKNLHINETGCNQFLEILFPGLVQSMYLKTLNLEGNMLDSDAMSLVADYLTMSPTLEDLNLSRNRPGFNPSTAALLGSAMCRAQKLRRLTLSDNNIDDVQLGIFAKELEGRTAAPFELDLSLNALVFGGPFTGEERGQVPLNSDIIAPLFGCVTSLNLEGNTYLYLNVKTLSTALKHATYLQKLSLVNTNMDANCVMIICTELKQLWEKEEQKMVPPLTSLDLSTNRVGRVGGMILADFLRAFRQNKKAHVLRYEKLF